MSFGLLSARDIVLQSVLEIEHATATKKDPRPGVWNDVQGPTGPQSPCRTCGGGSDVCVLGHWAHTTFTQPVPRSLHAQRTIFILQCVCFNCSMPLVLAKGLDGNILGRLRKMANSARKVRVCVCCGSKQPQWSFFGSKKVGCITASWPDPISPERLYSTVRNIPDEHLPMYGLDPIRSRPDSLFWMVFPIIPTPLRPLRQAKTGTTAVHQFDDFTTRLKSIVRLRDPGPVDIRTPSKAYTNLCAAVAGFCDARATPNTYGKALNSVWHSFNKDFSLMRDMVMSKRGDFIARAVITVDSNLHIREVGVPQWMTRKLTIPIRVCRVNISDVCAEMRRGNVPYVHKGNELTVATPTTPVVMGTIVERCLRDGDLVLLNRQPTLHTHSMMAHRVRVMDGSVLRIHLAVTPAYNADFDGDEMNLYVVRGEMARAEAQELMLVDHRILKDGVPIIKFSQSVIAALYRMDRADLERMIPIPFDRLDAKALNAKGGLICRMLDAYTDERVLDWMTDMYRAAESYISDVRPISMTLDDCFVDRELIGEASPEEAEGLSGSDLLCFYRAEAERIADRAYTILKGRESSLVTLVESGTKGTRENVQQIAGCIGLQFDHKQNAYVDGFIRSNFSVGLAPVEMFKHLQATRVGLMDTAARTRETGYLNRKLARSLEDLVVATDQTVRNSDGRVVSWRFLGDPGDVVGQLASQAIGEQLTQSNLRTFHMTGLEHGLRSGVSRVIAVIEARDLVCEVEARYGVEVAHDYIMKELTDALVAAGATVEHRHVSLIADAMTYTGRVTPLNFHGTDDRSVLLKASFERSFEVFCDAAYRGLTERSRSLTAAVTTGQLFYGGTGSVSLLNVRPNPVGQSDRTLSCVVRRGTQEEEEGKDGVCSNPYDDRPYSPTWVGQERAPSPSYQPQSDGEEDAGRMDDGGGEARAPSPSYRPSSPYDPECPAG